MGALIVCIQTGPEIWVSLQTIILSVSSQRCPKGWQPRPVGSQFAESLPPARGLWIRSLKHSGPLLLVIKYFSAFVNRFFFFLSSRDAENTTSYLSGRPGGTEVASDSANKLLASLSGEVARPVCFSLQAAAGHRHLHGPGPSSAQSRQLCCVRQRHLLKFQCVKFGLIYDFYTGKI